MADQLELSLDPNDDHIKLRWSKDDEPLSKPVRLHMGKWRKRSAELRDALSALNGYVRTNPNFEEQNDTGWLSYARVVKTLRWRGQALRNFLLGEDNPRSHELAQAINELQPGGELRVNCSDDEVTLPFGFIFEGDTEIPVGRPSRADFAGFWLDRFKITMLVEGSGCGLERRSVDPEVLKALYALHSAEVENSLPYLGSDALKLKQLTMLPVKEYYNWADAKRAYDSIRDAANIIFMFAHSDGDEIYFDDSGVGVDSNTLSLQLHKDRDPKHPILLILNCCLSATGGEGGSLLSVAARQGFCGLVGTEAEILNTYALRCGTRLMWELCFKGRSLGEALDAMQSAEDLFPLNLLYTCYAQRDFQLLRPIDRPNELLAAA